MSGVDNHSRPDGDTEFADILIGVVAVRPDQRVRFRFDSGGKRRAATKMAGEITDEQWPVTHAFQFQ